jgi:hypothetical protein
MVLPQEDQFYPAGVFKTPLVPGPAPERLRRGQIEPPSLRRDTRSPEPGLYSRTTFSMFSTAFFGINEKQSRRVGIKVRSSFDP